jgi:hypothetical protein
VRVFMTIPFLLGVSSACRDVPWGEVPEAPMASPVPASLICPGDPVPASADATGPTVEGRYPPPVYEVIQSKREAYQACNATAAWGGGPAGGRLHLSLSIGASGRVERACVRRPVSASGQAVTCVVDEIKALSFEPGSRADVTYPLDLEPVGAPEIEPAKPPEPGPPGWTR